MAVDGMSGAANEFIPTQYTLSLKPQYTFADSMVMADKKFSAVEFIVSFRTEIMADITKAGGRYLSTLFDTLKIPRKLVLTGQKNRQNSPRKSRGKLTSSLPTRGVSTPI